MIGAYNRINEFTFEPLNDVKDRIMHISIMDFEEPLYDTTNDFLVLLKNLKLQLKSSMLFMS